MAFVIGTDVTSSMTLIVTVTMEDIFVAHLFPAANAFGDDMINLYFVSILQEESTPATFPLLHMEEFPQCSTKHIMGREAFTPIEKVAIIGANSSLHFDVPLSVGAGMPPQF